MDNHIQKELKWAKFILFACLIPLVSAAFLAVGLLSHQPIINFDRFTLSDFNYHLEVFRGFWSNPNRDYYSVAVQRDVLMQVFAQPEDRVYAMPVGWTPHAFILFLPFVVLESFSPTLAYCGWAFFSAALFSYALYLSACRETPSRRGVYSLVVVCLVITLSDVWGRSVGLGQLSIVVVSIFLILARRTENRGSCHSFLEALSLAVLCLKPTYFIPGIVLYVGHHGVRRTILALGILSLANLAVLAFMGAPAFNSYLDTLLLYSSPESNPRYRSNFDLEEMTNLRAVFRTAPQWLLIVFNGVFFALVAGAFLSFFQWWSGQTQLSYLLAIAAVLLFSPYLGRYEDLLILAPVVGLVAKEANERHSLVPLHAIFVGIALLGTILALYDYGNSGINVIGKVVALVACVLGCQSGIVKTVSSE